MPLPRTNRRTLTALVTLFGVLTLAGRHADAACTTTWIGGVNGNFGTAGNWSPAAVPGTSDDVCITATTTTNPAATADTYTVILNGTFSIRSLTLGGANGKQTLVLPASNVTFSLTAASAITANGILTLGDNSGAGFSAVAGTAPLTNSGQLRTVVGGGGSRYLRTSISNAAAGTIDIGTTTNQDQAGGTTNNGAVTIGVAGSLALSGGAAFVNNAGAVTNNGVFSVTSGTFTQRGGTESGNPVLLAASTLDDDVGAAAAHFRFVGNGTLTGTGNNPGVASSQDITVAANNITTSLAKDLTNAGTITLGDGGGGFSVLAGPGALTNGGHLNTVVGGNGNTRYLRLNIDNAIGGSIDVDGTTRQDQGTLTSNSATVTIEPTGNLVLTGGSAFTNTAGSLTNNGVFSVSNGTFTQRAGTESGNPVLLAGSTLDDDESASAGLFTFNGNGTLTGSGTSPGVSATQVVTIAAGNISVAVAVNLTNAGVITLGDNNTGYSVLSGPGMLINNGALNTVLGGGGFRYLRLNIANSSTATVAIGGDTRQDSFGGASTFTNAGTVGIAAAASLTLTGGSSFTNNGGSVTNGNTFTVTNGTFEQRAGSETGNPVLLDNTVLDDDLAAGAGLFTFVGNGTLSGSGSMPGVASGQAVIIAANNITMSVAKNLTNAGTITLGDGGGGYSIVGRPGALTNAGRLNTIVGGGNTRFLRANITNTAAGTIDIAGATSQDQGTLTTNNGTVTIEVAGTLGLSVASSFTNAGGTVSNNGAFSVSTGTFTQRGGSETGIPVLLSACTLDDDLTAGNALFTFVGSGTLSGSGSMPGVAAGQTVTVAANNITLGLAKNLTNAGTITLGDSGGGFSVLGGPGTLTNSGRLNTVVGGGSNRFLRSNITNAAAGTIDIDGATNQDAGTVTSNNGTVTIEAGHTLALGAGSSFTQSATATFATIIDANTTTFGRLTGGTGPVSLDGTLKVTTVGSPLLDSSWPIISGATRSGQFATQDFGTNNYTVQYMATGVTLVAQVSPTATPPGPTQTLTGTPTRTLTGTPTRTRTLTPTNTPLTTSTVAPTSATTATTTPTSTPNVTPTSTPTGTFINLHGSVHKPGPLHNGEPHGLIAAAGVTVEVFVCENRHTCLATHGAAAGSTVTNGVGFFAISLSAPVVDGKLLLLVATIDGVEMRAMVTPHRRAPGSAGGAQGEPAADIEIDPIAEAATRLVAMQGLDNFSDDGVDAVIDAVGAANAATTFDGDTVAQAADKAEATAASDPAVQMVLEENQFTPTPTASATPSPTALPCAGDCNRNGVVTVDELVTGVNMALGRGFACPLFDANNSGTVTVDELITAVNDALHGC